jgi:hypothetical protein
VARIGLSLYLMLAILAGPSLCCCAPTRLLAFFPHNQKTELACHCCCHHATERDPAGPKTKDAGGKPCRAPEDHCPCRKGRSQQVLFTPAEDPSDVGGIRSLMMDRLTVAGLFLLSAESPALHLQEQGPRHCIAFPFHSSRDMLRALQILRC